MPSTIPRAAALAAFAAVLTLCAGNGSLGAQESASSGTSPESVEENLFDSTIALDVASADYYSLIAWVRQLGLSDAGTAETLRGRLYEHFKVTQPPPAAASTKTITIVSADRTEYLGARTDGESTVRFTGRVSLSVKDDESGEKLTIDADEVLINRDANILSARGDVVFERKKPDGSDFFLGEALELDMDDWSGVFLDGENRQGTAGKTDAESLHFSADNIIKRGSDVLVFSDGVISSSSGETPNYSIRASKIWILGGNEWAMLNATLSVGEVPLLYLPFFYYPGEEIVFHPVFGYDSRFGRYIQTTTYLLGAKPAKEQEISLLKITDGSGGYERKVEGVFLRTTRDKKKDANTDFIKVMADLYSNLGAFAAAQAQLASLGPLGSTTGFAGIGLSRSLFIGFDGVTYTPFVSANDFSSSWNRVDLYGLKLPFRFGWEFSTGIDAGPVKVSISMPFYSDSYFNRDFKDRSEDMNWLMFLDQESDDTTIAKISTFTDSLSLSGSLPASMLPSWISSVSLGKLASSLSWNSVAKATPSLPDEITLFSTNPTREFFVPYEWTIVDASVNVSGKLYSFPAKPAGSPAGDKGGLRDDTGLSPGTASVSGVESLLEDLPAVREPWSDTDDGLGKSVTGNAGVRWFSPPPLAIPETIVERVPVSAELTWSYSPTFSWRRWFLTGAWTEPSEVDWSALYETRTIRNAGTLTFTGALYEGLFSMSATLSASSQAQDRPRYSDNTTYVSDTLLTTWATQDAQYRNDKISATLKLTSSPFQDFWLWSPTSVGYNFSTLLYERAFDSIDSELNASYKETWADWTDGTVTAHSLSAVFGVKPWGYAQSLTLAADLPPILEGYSGLLSLKSGWAKLSMGTAYTVPQEGAEFEWDPLSASLTLGTTPWPTFTGSFLWDIEASAPSSFAANIAWEGLSLSVSLQDAIAYELVPGTGWVSTGESRFRASAATLVYKQSWKPPAVWKRRIAWTFDVDMSARQSFLRFSDSYMNVVLGFTFKVHEFLDISFASTSKNSSLWRYYPGLFHIPVAIEGVNPLEDILQSLNFFDPTGEARKNALFKLKSLSIAATHYLKDWDLAMKFSASPVFDETSLEYTFKPTFSITLSWRAVSQIKSMYTRDGDKVTWN
jgi:hypothetical protein